MKMLVFAIISAVAAPLVYADAERVVAQKDRPDPRTRTFVYPKRIVWKSGVDKSEWGMKGQSLLIQ